jgi:hypothetical protein
LLGFDPIVGDISLGFGISFLFETLLSKETMPCAFLTFFANVSVNSSDEGFVNLFITHQLTQMFSAGMFFCMALNLQ